MLKCVLTIAGSDSGAGAGIQADLKAISAQGGTYGLTAITAVTAQNTLGVDSFVVLSPQMVEAQVEAVMRDFPVAAVKTGMLGSEEVVNAVAAVLGRHGVRRVVVDPVMVAKSGDPLLEESARAAVQEKLLPLALVVTPNIPEAAVLCQDSINSVDDMKEAAVMLHKMGPPYVLLKGGHLGGRLLVDILFDGEKHYYYRAPRVQTRDTHGTGCTYASAIAAHAALGRTVPLAVKAAREYLQAILPRSPRLGQGSGPMDHFALLMRR